MRNQNKRKIEIHKNKLFKIATKKSPLSTSYFMPKSNSGQVLNNSDILKTPKTQRSAYLYNSSSKNSPRKNIVHSKRQKLNTLLGIPSSKCIKIAESSPKSGVCFTNSINRHNEYKSNWITGLSSNRSTIKKAFNLSYKTSRQSYSPRNLIADSSQLSNESKKWVKKPHLMFERFNRIDKHLKMNDIIYDKTDFDKLDQRIEYSFKILETISK